MWTTLRAAPAGFRCSTASAASTASTRRPNRCAPGIACSSSTAAGCATSSPRARSMPTAPRSGSIGMPKVDCLVDGSLCARRGAADTRPRSRRGRRCCTRRPGRRPHRSTRWASTWCAAAAAAAQRHREASRSFARSAARVFRRHRLGRRARPARRTGRERSSRRRRHLSVLVAADLMITDHSSGGFEYLLLDRPLVRIHLPELIEARQHPPGLRRAAADVADSTTEVDDAVAAVERALADPRRTSCARRAVAADSSTNPAPRRTRCAAALYEAIGLEPRAPSQPRASPTSGTETENPDNDYADRQRNHAGVQRRAVPRRGGRIGAARRRSPTRAVIVNDGSTDAPWRWRAARRRGLRASGRWTSANAGPGPARNTGFRAATGRCSRSSTATTSGTRRSSPSRSRFSTRARTVDILIGNARNRGGAARRPADAAG